MSIESQNTLVIGAGQLGAISAELTKEDFEQVREALRNSLLASEMSLQIPAYAMGEVGMPLQ